jgi:hypothetical protein
MKELLRMPRQTDVQAAIRTRRSEVRAELKKAKAAVRSIEQELTKLGRAEAALKDETPVRPRSMKRVPWDQTAKRIIDSGLLNGSIQPVVEIANTLALAPSSIVNAAEKSSRLALEEGADGRTSVRYLPTKIKAGQTEPVNGASA